MPEVNKAQFRTVFDAPELKQPIIFARDDRNLIIPFDRFQIEDDGHFRRGILETSPYDELERDLHENPDSYADEEIFVRVKYDSMFGLKAKTWQLLRRIKREAWSSDQEAQEPELLLVSGYVRRDFGPVSISLDIGPLSAIHAAHNFTLRNQDSFQININVIPTPTNLEEKPSFAQITYTKGDWRVPIEGKFVDAEYNQVLTDETEGLNSPSTYFRGQHLIGTVLGRRWLTNDQSPKMKSIERNAKVNPKTLSLLRGSPYKVGLYRHQPKFEKGRLIFARRNTESGESWILSVPEWIDNHGFSNSLSGYTRDCVTSFPVTFGVRREGQKDQWFSTFGRSNRESEILDALTGVKRSTPRVEYADTSGF